PGARLERGACGIVAPGAQARGAVPQTPGGPAGMPVPLDARRAYRPTHPSLPSPSGRPAGSNRARGGMEEWPGVRTEPQVGDGWGCGGELSASTARGREAVRVLSSEGAVTRGLVAASLPRRRVTIAWEAEWSGFFFSTGPWTPRASITQRPALGSAPWSSAS